MALYLTGNTSNITIDSTSGITFPNATLQTVAAQTGPAFSAYASVTQTIAPNTTVKILFDTEEFDTNNNYASSRFTPTVAGYYQISTNMVAVYPSGESHINVYKNGNQYKQLNNTTGAYTYALGGTCIVYCNGSTDYIEIYAYSSTGVTNLANSFRTWFQGCLVRVA